MTVSDETLMAYADGQLDRAEQARVRKFLAQDPALRSRLEVFQATGHGLAPLFSEQMYAPLPEGLKRIAAAQPAAKGHRLAQFADTLKNLLYPATPPFGLAAASAATLIAGIGLGWLIHGGAESRDYALNEVVRVEDSRIVAGAALGDALDSLQSGKEAALPFSGDRSVRIAVNLSFKDRAQDYCRQYRIRMDASENYEGIACKSGGLWNIQLHALGAPVRHRSGKSMPAGASGTALETAVMAMIEGDALNPQDEEKMILNGWTEH